MTPVMQSWLALAFAILAEVSGSSFLLKSQQFTKLLPSAAVVFFYVVSFYCLSLALRHIPLGIAYGVWSGVGIVLTAGIGYFVFRQSLDLAALLGIAFIVTGVMILNFVSKASLH